MKADIILYGRIPSKKNNRRGVRTRRGANVVVSSKKHKDWESCQVNKLMWENATPRFSKVNGIVMDFYFPDDRKTDLTNKAESIMDMLVKAKVIVDDCWQKTGSLFLMPCGIDREEPRVEIFFTGGKFE